MRNISGTSGLARTKENFPALGGGNGGGGAGPTGSTLAARAAQSQHPVAAVFKKPTSSAASGGRSGPAASNGMLLHVSNRPGAAVPKKAAAPQLDFPALPGKGNKKNLRNLEEDMLPSGSAVPMTNISAKHRSLADDYVSVANPTNFHKLQLVQKEEDEAKARQEALKKSAPKLTASEFPSLGPSASASSSRANAAKPASGPASLNWSKPTSEKKQRELENRKAKVAPAPVLPTPTSRPAPKANNNNVQEQQANKKDKKPKDKKNNQENQPKPVKQKEKNNNNEQKSNGGPATPIRAPPGLGSGGPLKPPPGFVSNVTVNSVAKLPNNLTFTSSLGESYNIVPSPYTYTDPPDTGLRNQVRDYL